MEKLRSELMFIAGISMICVSYLIKDNVVVSNLFYYNGIFFCVRSIISDVRNEN